MIPPNGSPLWVKNLKYPTPDISSNHSNYWHRHSRVLHHQGREFSQMGFTKTLEAEEDLHTRLDLNQRSQWGSGAPTKLHELYMNFAALADEISRSK